MQKFESNPRQKALSPFSGKVASVVSKIFLVVIYSIYELLKLLNLNTSDRVRVFELVESLGC